MQNSSFQVTVTEENLTAPVTSLSYRIYSTTHCDFTKYGERLYKYENGTWVQAEREEYRDDSYSDNPDGEPYPSYTPKPFYDMKLITDGFQDAANWRYEPLEPGLYRLVVSLNLRVDLDEDDENYEYAGHDWIQLYPTAVFIVTAPEE